MKNKFVLAILIAIGLNTGSCKKFFEVNPKTEVPNEQLFKTESGFQDALAGVYIQLKEDNAYGRAMTMTTMEHLVSSWDVSNNSPAYWLGLHNFEAAGAELALADIYRQLYKVIAGINNILSHIDKQKDLFSPGMYELIKGECLALRAHCHFDLLRLFGPVPTDPALGNKLPYVKTISKFQNQLLPFERFQQEVIDDLLEAEELLAHDPFKTFSAEDFKNEIFRPSGDFSSYRYLRMNYYAVKALQARVYLWFNKKEKAFECANEIINAKNQDGSLKFRLGRSNDMTSRNYVLTSEHIFGLHDFKLFTKYQGLFGNGNLKKGSNEIMIRSQLYGNTGTDIREAHLWEIISSGSVNSYILKKYQVPETISQLHPDIHQIPLIRLSEMYFIVMETGPMDRATVLWEEFKQSRNFSAPELPLDEIQKGELLTAEYRKEFYGEGQAFFAYKRLNTPKSGFLFAPASANINYLPPLPKIETTIIK